MKLFPVELLDGLKRQQFYSPGTLILIIILASPIILWLSHSPESIKDPLVAIAKFNAFTAISLLSVNFILSVRSNYLEVLFRGLDRMYRVHKAVGRASMTFMLLHPLFLGISKLPETGHIIEFIFPVGNIAVASGVLSVYIFLLLLTLSVVVRIPYHIWHNSHKFMGLVLVLAGFHAVAAGSDLASFPILRFWIILMVCSGVTSWIFMLVFYKLFGPRYQVKIDKVDHLRDITEIQFARPNGFRYQPGQYLFIRFPRFEGNKELFPFSISNDPCQPFVRISVRRSGDYTSTKIPLVKEGDDAIVMGPYGKFGKRYLTQKKDMIWIAGGIGITPFLSLAKHESVYPTGRRIHLFWVIKENRDAFHDSELFIEAKRNDNFDYVHWFTGMKGRITAEDIIKIVGGTKELANRVFFICGPPGMMETLSKDLHRKGVAYKNIIFEDFDMLD